MKHSVFLPPLTLQSNATYKKKFEAVGQAAFFGSESDGVIQPWYSSVWSYLDAGGNRVPMEQQSVWVNDTLGLRSLNQTGRLLVEQVRGVHHGDWLRNPALWDQHIYPRLK